MQANAQMPPENDHANRMSFLFNLACSGASQFNQHPVFTLAVRRIRPTLSSSSRESSDLVSVTPTARHHALLTQRRNRRLSYASKGNIMRISSVFLPATLLLVASICGAQTMPYPQDDTAPVTTVVVSAAATSYLIRQKQIPQIAGIYEMTNGWRIKVQPRSRTIDTTIDQQKPMRLLAVSPYKFASGDGRVTMEFNRGDTGDDMIMSYVPDPRLAEMVVISSSIAQR